MKIVPIALMVGAAAACQGCSCAAYGDPSCDSEKDKECCGTAVPDKKLSSTATKNRRVCNSLGSNHFTDAGDPGMTYTFLCLPEPAARNGA